MPKRKEKEDESNYFTSDEESGSSMEWGSTQATKKIRHSMGGSDNVD
uniref:Uncharacterized protein n=1 Tax=Heterorhabditis bacteriophora TaxID=37862 RepID=A0A1I7WE08_HETBA